MNPRLKFILWLLPLAGIVLGYAYAYLFFHGLLETWYLIGTPGEKIARIVGIFGRRKVLVATETGKLYAFGFYTGERVSLPTQLSWEKEQLDLVDPASTLQYEGADFYSLPPLFQVEQLYDMEYIYRVEGKGEVKFALAVDGNLWMWSHKISGLTGLVFAFYPVFGFLIGAAIAIIVTGVNWLNTQLGHTPAVHFK